MCTFVQVLPEQPQTGKGTGTLAVINLKRLLMCKTWVKFNEKPTHRNI